ncbi:unnamed protein product [Plutella xylostella]|uniref:BUD13 homolog n=1 Tax=Plutella xylostella TaxID=51655 RepID=A0A8S4ENG6_PLUXY|nr:unnamed protein product [Plutella xylostella]
MTTTKIDQKAYLQKYLTGSSGDKKKKKKKKAPKPTGLKIIDDDLDYSKLRSLDGDELDILDQGEDAPQIAGIIDERTEVIKAEEYSNRSSKWRVITQDDGFNSKLQIEEITKDKKQKEKENEIIFGKMYSDSEDEEKKDVDASPPRKTSNSNQKPDTSKKPQNNSDSDFSPPRKDSKRSPPPKTTKNKKDYDSDVSPVRKSSSSNHKSHKSKNRQNNSDSDFSPPRKESRTSSPPRKASSSKNNYDSEVSQSRKHDSSHKSREKTKKPSRWGGYDESREKSSKSRRKSPDSDIPVQRKSRKYSDASPPRKNNSSSKRRKSPSEDPSPPRRKKNYDSDQSPPRKSRRDSPKRRKSPDSSPPRKRRSSVDKPKDQRSQKRHQSSDSDMSPPRKNQRHRAPSQDSDASPPRKNRRPESPQRIDKNNYRKRNDDSPPPSNKKMEKTLDGKLAGLQDAGMLRKENEAFRRREDEVFSKMTDDVSGRNAQVVSRKTGKKRETSEERRQQQEKAEKQKVIDDLYKKWGKGLKQIEQQESRYQDFVHEAAKPLARHRDDKDLESTLKDVERDGDPMLAYIREKKRDRGELPPELPTYKGNFPPNRFNIRPGFRWDGVDRSNGYETKYFDTQSKKKAQADEYYKWSSADM